MSNSVVVTSATSAFVGQDASQPGRASEPPVSGAARVPRDRDVTLADIHLPPRFRPNAAGAEAERLAREEARALGLFEGHDVRRFDAGSSIAKYVWPTADVERLTVCCQWVNALFYIDDFFDENKEFVADEARVLATMEACLDLLRDGTPMPGFPAFSALLLRLRARLGELGSERWFDALHRSTEQYLLLGVLPAVRAWRSGRLLGVEAYMRSREFDSGVYTCIDFIEIASGLELPEAVRQSDEIQALRRLCARHVAFVNDVMSYGKEVPCHDNPSNLIHALMVERGLSFAEAARATVDLVNDDMVAFDLLAASLPDWGAEATPAVRAYVDGMYHWMRGNVEWSLGTRRYMTATNPFPELRAARR